MTPPSLRRLLSLLVLLGTSGVTNIVLGAPMMRPTGSEGLQGVLETVAGQGSRATERLAIGVANPTPSISVVQGEAPMLPHNLPRPPDLPARGGTVPRKERMKIYRARWKANKIAKRWKPFKATDAPAESPNILEPSAIPSNSGPSVSQGVDGGLEHAVGQGSGATGRHPMIVANPTSPTSSIHLERQGIPHNLPQLPDLLPSRKPWEERRAIFQQRSRIRTHYFKLTGIKFPKKPPSLEANEVLTQEGARRLSARNYMVRKRARDKGEEGPSKFAHGELQKRIRRSQAAQSGAQQSGPSQPSASTSLTGQHGGADSGAPSSSHSGEEASWLKELDKLQAIPGFASPSRQDGTHSAQSP